MQSTTGEEKKEIKVILNRQRIIKKNKEEKVLISRYSLKSDHHYRYLIKIIQKEITAN